MLTPEQAEGHAREHVAYEISMLVATARRLATAAPGPERNAFLESFVIHARVVDDFLCGDRDRPSTRDLPRVGPDDVIARDFASQWPRAEAHFMPTREREMANKLVAHLTVVRIDREPIEVHGTAVAVLEGFRQFAGQLPEEKRDWFTTAANTAGIYLGLPMVPTEAVSATTTSLTTGSLNAVLPRLVAALYEDPSPRGPEPL